MPGAESPMSEGVLFGLRARLPLSYAGSEQRRPLPGTLRFQVNDKIHDLISHKWKNPS